MDQTDIIDLYLKGLLQGEELDKFLLEMKENEALAEDVEIKKQIIGSIQGLRHEELKNYIARQTKENVLVRLPGPKWAYGVAASFLLLASTFFIFQDQIPKNVNPIAIFQPKNKLKKDTLLVEKNKEIPSDANKITSFESDDNMTELEIDTVTSNLEEVILDAILDGEKDIDVRQDKIVRTHTAITVEHANRMNLIDSSNNNEKVSSSAPTISKNEAQISSDKKVKSTEVKTPAIVHADDHTSTEFKKDKNQKIQIEFWQSIVSYRGYKWNGKTLRLYGIDSISILEIHHLDNNYYVQINKEFYLLRLTDNYESYIKITDAALKERLKKQF